MKNIDGVKAGEVTEVARDLFDPDRLAVAIVGPIKESIFDAVRWDNLKPRKTRKTKKAA